MDGVRLRFLKKAFTFNIWLGLPILRASWNIFQQIVLDMLLTSLSPSKILSKSGNMKNVYNS